jgi:hypothetical protein
MSFSFDYISAHESITIKHFSATGFTCVFLLIAVNDAFFSICCF